MNLSQQIKNLLDGIQSIGYNVVQDDDYILIYDHQRESSFKFESHGGWIHLTSTMLSLEELPEPPSINTLESFILKIQHRCLGCKFSYDDDGVLAIDADVYPGQQNPDDLAQIIDQMSYVAGVILPFLERIVESNEIPSDRDVDIAFNLDPEKESP